MSVAAAPAPQPGQEAGSRPEGARLLLLLAAVVLLLSLLLGWDGGLRDQLSPSEIATARRNELLQAFDTEPSSPFALLVPFGLALLAVASLAVSVAVRGVTGRGERVVLGGALLCTLSLLVRQGLDDAPGVPEGSLLATGALLAALPAASRLPAPAREHRPGWPVLALGLVSAALLTGMVHDAYSVVDVDEGILGGYGVEEGTSWPQTWLAAPVGSRTLVDLLLILVASCGLVAAALAAAFRLERPAGTFLAAFAAFTLSGLLVLAIGPNPGVSGVDRFPAALGAVVALVATIPLALRASAQGPAPSPERDEAEPEPPPAPDPEPRRVAPPEAWAHPDVRPHGWWS